MLERSSVVVSCGVCSCKNLTEFHDTIVKLSKRLKRDNNPSSGNTVTTSTQGGTNEGTPIENNINTNLPRNMVMRSLVNSSRDNYKRLGLDVNILSSLETITNRGTKELINNYN